MQKLSIEYARLVRENERLRGVIQSAVNMLQDSTTKVFKKGKLIFVKIHTHQNPYLWKGSVLRVECTDCVGSVGQAIWDCGTLDIDCIK